jgi:hypothetical protein
VLDLSRRSKSHDIASFRVASYDRPDRVAHEHENTDCLLLKLDQAILAKAFRGEWCLVGTEDKSSHGRPRRLAALRVREA